MHRFFLPQANIALENILTFNDSKEIHHLQTVLRLRPGDKLTLFNGNGEEALAEIISSMPTEVQIKILELRSQIKQKPFRILLACAIPKKAKFETIIEKTTELGIDEIFPLLTERTEVRLNPDQARHKAQRYRAVAINAAKQSHRLTVPLIHEPLSIRKLLAELAREETLLLIPCLIGERKTLATLLPLPETKKDIFIFIGPEGDFTESEIAEVKNSGGIPVSLGETVLKVDTAAISVVAFLNFFNQDPA